MFVIKCEEKEMEPTKSVNICQRIEEEGIIYLGKIQNNSRERKGQRS